MEKYKKIAIVLLFQILCLTVSAIISLIITSLNFQQATNYGSIIYTSTTMFMLVLIVIIEIISAIKISSSSVHSIFTSAAVLLNFLFSSDVMKVLSGINSNTMVYENVAEYIGFITYLLIILTHLFLLNHIYKTGIKKNHAIILIACAVLDCGLYILLKFLSLEFIAYIAYIPATVWGLYKIYRHVIKSHNHDTTFILTTSVFYAALGMQGQSFLYAAGVLSYTIYGIETTYILLINLMYMLVYGTFMLSTERDALKASKYKLETERIKTKLLREQINPHFIFNSLTTVKDAYHENLNQGDMAMGYFSRYLRSNVEAMNLDCIPLDDELDNVENYIHLENMRRKKAVNIVYDIEYSEFSVPVLSLQTFVENSVRYARTEDKKDGYIAVSSHKCADGAIVKIIDNGAGFDANSIKENSCGIRNAKERFKLLLDGEVTIESSKNNGTTVKIFIPERQSEKTFTEEYNADNNS